MAYTIVKRINSIPIPESLTLAGWKILKFRETGRYQSVNDRLDLTTQPAESAAEAVRRAEKAQKKQ